MVLDKVDDIRRNLGMEFSDELEYSMNGYEVPIAMPGPRTGTYIAIAAGIGLAAGLIVERRRIAEGYQKIKEWYSSRQEKRTKENIDWYGLGSQ